MYNPVPWVLRKIHEVAQKKYEDTIRCQIYELNCKSVILRQIIKFAYLFKIVMSGAFRVSFIKILRQNNYICTSNFREFYLQYVNILSVNLLFCVGAGSISYSAINSKKYNISKLLKKRTIFLFFVTTHRVVMIPQIFKNK